MSERERVHLLCEGEFSSLSYQGELDSCFLRIFNNRPSGSIQVVKDFALHLDIPALSLAANSALTPPLNVIV